MVHQLAHPAGLQDGDHIVVCEQSPCCGAPHVDPPAVRDQKIGVGALKGAFDALDREAEIAGQQDGGIPSRLSYPYQAGAAGEREHPEQGLEEADPGETHLFHRAMRVGLRATTSAKLCRPLSWMDSIEKPAFTSLSERSVIGCVVCCVRR